jgi:hypothetical protein
MAWPVAHCVLTAAGRLPAMTLLAALALALLTGGFGYWLAYRRAASDSQRMAAGPRGLREGVRQRCSAGTDRLAAEAAGWDAHRVMSAVTTPASTIRRRPGKGPAGW